jgi:exonuclease III
MRALSYNIRGFGREGRRSQLRDYIRTNRLDIIGLQETIKQDFSTAELRSLEVGGLFAWNHLPAVGHSGGMLLGFRDESFEVGAWRMGTFFLSATVLQRNNNMKWCFMLIYGPADHSRTEEFLGELELAVQQCPVPLVVAGDFNLIRSARDNNNGNINWPWIRRFNGSIAAMSLREINRAGARFTWTNRQLCPIRCVLDRVFVSPAWEAAFPFCSVTAITRIGSDHNPLLLDSGEVTLRRPPRFFFQTWWFRVAGFGELINGKLHRYLHELGPHWDNIDGWQCTARNLRQFLKGWGANLGRNRGFLGRTSWRRLTDWTGRRTLTGWMRRVGP